MTHRQTVESALAAWREAERRLIEAAEEHASTTALAAEVDRWRAEFQRLSAEHMAERIEREAAELSQASPPSSTYHERALAQMTRGGRNRD